MPADPQRSRSRLALPGVKGWDVPQRSDVPALHHGRDSGGGCIDPPSSRPEARAIAQLHSQLFVGTTIFCIIAGFSMGSAMLIKTAIFFLGFMFGLFVFSLMSMASRADDSMDIEDDIQ